MVCLGLDIGTTHACVGVYHNGKVNIIANHQGFRSTPCFISFDGECPHEDSLVGDTALEKHHANTSKTVYHFKTALGKTFEEMKASKAEEDWTFSITKDDPTSLPVVEIINEETGDKKHSVTPELFCSVMMTNLKKLAEDFTGEDITDAVLTVPVHFTDAQRSSLRSAADAAGLSVLAVLDDPIAACIAYGFDEVADVSNPSEPEYLIVYDLGGATHDITLVCVDNGLFSILSTAGGNKVGGESFTSMLMAHCIQSFSKQNSSVEIPKSDSRAMSRLKAACESAKRSLSQQTRVNIEVDSFAEGADLIVKISRSRFEEMIYDSVKSTMADIDVVLEEGDLDKESVSKVVLIGGSSRIPLVQRQLEKFFDGKSAEIKITPDEAIAYGATVEANAVSENASYDITSAVEEFPAVPLSVGVKASSGKMEHLIYRDSVLPASATAEFTTSEDNQSVLAIEVYEGERLVAKDNTLLSVVTLENLPTRPAGQVTVTASFTIDSRGNLVVTATEASSGISVKEEIPHAPTRLTLAAIEELVQVAEDALDADDELVESLEQMELDAINASITSTTTTTTETSSSHGEMD